MSRKYFLPESLEKVSGNINHGWFDILKYTNDTFKHYSYKLTERRNRACSMSANCKQSGGRVYFYIPLDVFPKKVQNNQQLIEDLENALKDWVRFGRQCMIPGKYLGLMELKNLEFDGDNKQNIDLLPLHQVWCDNADRMIDDKNKNTYAFVITWDHKDQINGKHGLGILSFYRYFYSNISNEVYKNAVKLFNLIEDWNELDCLIFAHYLCRTSYTGYFGLVDKDRVFKRISSLKRLNYKILHESGSVNRQWTLDIGNLNTSTLKKKFSSITGIGNKIRDTNQAALYEFIRRYLTEKREDDKFVEAVLNVDKALN